MTIDSAQNIHNTAHLRQVLSRIWYNFKDCEPIACFVTEPERRSVEQIPLSQFKKLTQHFNKYHYFIFNFSM